MKKKDWLKKNYNKLLIFENMSKYLYFLISLYVISAVEETNVIIPTIDFSLFRNGSEAERRNIGYYTQLELKTSFLIRIFLIYIEKQLVGHAKILDSSLSLVSIVNLLFPGKNNQMVYLTFKLGHGIRKEVIDNVWKTTSDFFDLPSDKKLEISFLQHVYPYGYNAMGDETLSVGKDTENTVDVGIDGSVTSTVSSMVYISINLFFILL